MATSKRAIVKRVTPSCSICGKKMRVVLYADQTYRGGHYFGEIPLYKKSELKKMRERGTHKSKIGAMKVEVYNYDPKPYSHAPYWECAKCYFK